MAEEGAAPRLALVVAVLASFVVFVDSTLVNVVVPAVRAELGGGLSGQQWVVNAYLVTLGSLMLVAGSLSDVYGRIPVLRAGLIGFGASSVLIAASPSIELLVIMRGVQGVAGALLVPSSLALITSYFSGRGRARAIGTWTAWTGVAVMAGPVAGGVFVDFWSWRPAFLVTLIPIVATLVLLTRLPAGRERTSRRRIDLLGAVLSTGGLVGIVFALIEQRNLGWSHPAVLASLGVGVVLGVAFVVWQRFTAEPIMPLALFTVRNFAWGNLATALIYGAMALANFVLVVFLQQVAGFGATAVGFAMLPSTLLLVVLSPWFGRLSHSYGPRWFMAAGPVVCAGGYALLLPLDASSSLVEVVPGVLVVGLGLAIAVAPLTSTILGSVDPDRSGVASAINNAVARIAGLVTIATLGMLVGNQLDDAGLHRALLLTVVLMLLAGLASSVGVRTSRDALVE